MANAQNYTTVEYIFKAEADGTNGHRFTLCSAQDCVNDKVFLYIGAGTFVPPTAAICNLLVQDALGNTLTPPTGFVVNPYAQSAAQLQILSTGIKNFMATLQDVETTAGDDAAGYGLGFAVGGLNIKNVLSVEVTVIPGTGAIKTSAAGWNSEVNVKLPNPMSLGATSNLIVTGATELAIGTDNVIIAPTGHVFGAFNIDADTFVNATDKGIVCLKLRIVQ